MIVLLVTIFFLSGYISLFLYYRNGWQSLSVFKSGQPQEYSMISVLVPARNEEHNIYKLLQLLKDQQYPASSFEVIVIDDFSSDQTAAIVQEFKGSNVRLIRPSVLPKNSSKKKAIEEGIRQSKGTLIVTTDADCSPGQNWLYSLNACYLQNEANFIAAPVQFYHNNTLLQSFQATDFLMLQGITAASVASQFHTMCNGANLAYTKDAFQSVKGFEGIDHVASGDDMLLMYKIWKKDPAKVVYLKSKEATVHTQPMKNWKDFFMQRKRWASKSLVYDDYRIIIVLGLVYFFNLWFLVLLVLAVFQPFYWWYVLGYLIVKSCAELLLINPVAGFYGERKLLRYFFFLQPFHILYTVIIGLWSQAGRYEWKGRNTK